MEGNLISYETVLDLVKGWPIEGDFPPPAKRDNHGRPLWDRVEIERFAHKKQGMPL